MGIQVDVVRVFTDPEGHHGNPLGIVDATQVAPPDRQRVATTLGYSETVFVDIPEPNATIASAQIFTPAAEIPFAGHPTVGLAWWLAAHGRPVDSLSVPAGEVATHATGDYTWVRAKPDWAPEFTLHCQPDTAAVAAVAAASFDAGHHYIWAWAGEGAIRSRMFAPDLGVPEDEATGAAALRITEHLRRDLHITQGRGSRIVTRIVPDGWIEVGGRVQRDRPVTI